MNNYHKKSISQEINWEINEETKTQFIKFINIIAPK